VGSESGSPTVKTAFQTNKTTSDNGKEHPPKNNA
jgi:hypothetical protein